MCLLRTCILPSEINMIFSILFLTALFTTRLAQTTNPSLTTTTNNNQNECPNYWLGTGDTCYFISDYLTSWNDARDFCNFMEADLVILSDERMQKDVMMYGYKMLNSNVKNFWLGLNDLKSPGDFVWVDETEPMFTNWLLNDTDGASGNCVMLDVETGYWENQNCSSQFGFICSKQGMFNQSMDIAECEGGMKRYGNSCYWTVPGENNWQSAENWCETENGNLTTISSSLENMFLYSFVRQQPGAYWIGLYVDDGGLKWEADKQDTFFNWDGPPEISPVLCAVMERNGKWLMQLCEGNQITTAICEKPVSDTNLSFPTTHIGTSCPPMWINIQDKCYMVVTVPTTWEGARNQCLSLGADLVTLKSREDEMRVLDLVTNTDDSSGGNFWLGLRLVNDSGVKDWRWNDQNRLSYTNWNILLVHENVTADAQKFCAIFEIITRKWTIEPCSLTAIYVCESHVGHWNLSCDGESCQPPVQLDSTQSPQPVDPFSSLFGLISTQDADDFYPKTNPCPPEWQIFDDKCYLIKGELPVENANWTSASFSCRSKGDEYDLVSIHSPIEHEFLLNELKSLGMERAWIGLNDKAIEGQFVWSDGSNVDYSDWAWQEMLTAKPNKFSTTTKTFAKMTADCVKIEMTAIAGKWTANDCNVKLGYICQKTFRSSMISTPPVPFPPTHSAISTSTSEDTSESNQFTDEDIDPPSIIPPNDIIPDVSDDSTNLDVTEATDITEQIAHTWIPEGDSSLGVSDASEIDNKEVSPIDADNFVTAKCKCESESRMTSGTIAGITLSCILAAALVTIAFFHWRRRRLAPTVGSGKFGFDNALYNPHADHIQLDTNVLPTNN